MIAQREEFPKGTKHLELMHEEYILDRREEVSDDIQKMKLKTGREDQRKETKKW